MRIAIVNDLRLAVESLRRTVATLPGATIAWVAEDGAQAVAMCAKDKPDVVLMDMIMPVMDGVEATRRIMRATPCPILVVTATVEGNASRVFEALGAGALDAVATPRLTPDGSVADAEALVRKIRTVGLISGPIRTAPLQPAAPDVLASGLMLAPMVVIGVSTGGPQALATVLRAMPTHIPWPLVVVQHIDESFAPGFAAWLARETSHSVEIVRAGEAVIPGRVTIASTGDHLVIDRYGRFAYTAEPRELAFRPSVDVFFNSIAAAKAVPGVAVLLTGMGRDGAAAMGRLRSLGWHTIAQDKETSVVWGMPGAAVEIGAATEVLPISAIGPAIVARMAEKIGKSGENGGRLNDK